MAICKCKMCGGDLRLTELDKVVTCEYCGTAQTVPKADDEKKMTLFNRANRLRMNNEFDPAAALYEQLVAEFPEESEAYWGLCLCNYGIEYVDDPATGQKKPTCHRASFRKLTEDENFGLAMEYADVMARKRLREEAREIDRINEEILALSRNESPYDIFICYKETDEAGNRTPDSVLAQDIYDALTAKGYKVFFSRITLEDKLGLQYEPYIFAALNSAKIMLCVGTAYEYFHAVWVRNEWGRFLRLAAKDKRKVLIPCYKNMDPYDLPDEFKGLQALDLGKIGALQDLARGVDKLFGRGAYAAPAAEKPAASVGRAAVQSNVESLLTRGFLSLEDGDWRSADGFFEQALNVDATNAQAYLGKLMAEAHARTRAALRDCPAPFTPSPNYQKIIRFGDEALKTELDETLRFITQRNENARLASVYARATALEQNAHTLADYEEALRLFGSIPGYKDAGVLAAECEKGCVYARAEAAKYNGDIHLAKELFSRLGEYRDASARAGDCGTEEMRVYCEAEDVLKNAKTPDDYSKALKLYRSVSGYKNADERADEARKKVEAAPSEKSPEKSGCGLGCGSAFIVFLAAVLIGVIISYLTNVDFAENPSTILLASAFIGGAVGLIMFFAYEPIKNRKKYNDRYNNASRLLSEGNYGAAAEVFSQLGGYKNSEELEKDARYRMAAAAAANGDPVSAYKTFTLLASYKDSALQADACRETIYRSAAELQKAGRYAAALAAYETLDDYKDKAAQCKACRDALREDAYLEAAALVTEKKYAEAIPVYEKLKNYKDSPVLLNMCMEQVYGKEIGERLSGVNVGENYLYGVYRQEDGRADGKKPIEWLVLEKKGTSALLVSRFALDCKPFNFDKEQTAWKFCSLRRWLNGEFLHSAFTPEEQNRIMFANIPVTDPAGTNVKDKVFLLSADEAKRYFSADVARRCAASPYAVSLGAYTSSSFSADGAEACRWWLRSSGSNAENAAFVRCSGSCDSHGVAVNAGDFSVRPALWLNLAGKTVMFAPVQNGE